MFAPTRLVGWWWLVGIDDVDVSHFSSEPFYLSSLGGLAAVHLWYIVLDKYCEAMLLVASVAS